jgi:two-component system sensor histidine kinase HydH
MGSAELTSSGASRLLESHSNGGGAAMTDKVKSPWVVLIALLVAGITSLHYATHFSNAYEHTIYRELYFLPVTLAAFAFGFRGCLATSLTITALYLPFVLLQGKASPLYRFDNVLEILLLNVVAVALGILRNRERLSQRRLCEAESLAAMGRALSGVAHDMKLPLVAIGGYTAFVMKRLGESDPNRQKLDVVVRQVQRLETMVKNMLDFSRPLQLEKSATHLEKLLGDVAAVAKAEAASRGVDLELQSHNGLTPVSVDPGRLEQALLNLVSNAVQASKSGDAVKLKAIAQEGKVAIEVSDRGDGIPERKRCEIFTPFYTTKKGGTGLGLAIVKKIVEAHQGRLELMDNPDRGVTFRIVLPKS